MAIVASPLERSPAQLEETSTVELVKEAMDEAKELVRLEVELAKEDVKSELLQVRKAAIGFGIAAASGLIVLSLLAIALVLALGATPIVALLVAAMFLVIAAMAGYVGYAMLPKVPLEQTRNRLQNDVNQLKEQIA